MKADILREKFLEFFKVRKHKIVESDSLVPKDDPTVLFTPAGMSQFKKEFMGFDAGFTRAATSQRCLRTDDLDKVGHTIGHHTFFEMLGNFSFGDYFKKEAILWAWEFLTQELKIDKEKLWVSVYKDDEESYAIWKDIIKVPVEKIVKLGDKENFWPSEAKQMGPDGPCGPCSEIFFDFGKDIGCGEPVCDPSCSCGRFVEVWNLVFTQFNRKANGVLEPLPKKNIDTGMGLERLSAVMQGVRSNFETDLFVPIIKEIASFVVRRSSFEKELIYAVADHIRAVAFAIYDGVLPSNEARGYVARKIIRKSVLALRQLGINKPFLYKLVPALAEIMKKPYPDLVKRRENIAEIILAEEKNFIFVLNSSESLFKEKFSAILEKKDAKEAGKTAFVLYDTYGIPFELTLEWADKHGINISKEVFDGELLRQKGRSKSQSAMKGDVFGLGNIDYGVKETQFLGYESLAAETKILKIFCAKKEKDRIKKGEEAAIILEKSVFYAESGGQLGDSGRITDGKNIFDVVDTKKSGAVILHIGKVSAGEFKKGANVLAEIDKQRRDDTAKNHTATHLLQAALRKVLGAHVQQQGSLVAQDKLRFDFTHFRALTEDEVSRVEEIVNVYISEKHPLGIQEMDLSQAKKTGALAFFAEKYADKVRVVSAGNFSKELCGGTHLKNTSEIGCFRITHEGSVASGIRRIEAVTGDYAYALAREDKKILLDVSKILNVPVENITREIEKKTALIKELESRLKSQVINSLKSGVDGLIQGAAEIKGIKFISAVMNNLDMGMLRKNVDLIKEKTGSAVIAIGSAQEGRAFLVAAATPDLVQRGIDASVLIKEAAVLIGGSGGGRKDFAQAGGGRPENLRDALEAVKNTLERSI